MVPGALLRKIPEATARFSRKECFDQSLLRIMNRQRVGMKMDDEDHPCPKGSCMSRNKGYSLKGSEQSFINQLINLIIL